MRPRWRRYPSRERISSSLSRRPTDEEAEFLRISPGPALADTWVSSTIDLGGSVHRHGNRDRDDADDRAHR